MVATQHSIQTVLNYGWTDLWFDRQVTLLTILLYVAILTPLLMLYILKFGVITAWANDLSKDTRNREVGLRGQYSIQTEKIEEIAGWTETGFVVPESSYLVSTQTMRKTSPGRGPYADINIRTTAVGDPAMGDSNLPAPNTNQIVLSAATARELEASTGDILTIRLSRQPKGRSVESARVKVEVLRILAEEVWPEKNAFITPGLSMSIRDWIEFAAPDVGAFRRRAPDDNTVWQSIRIYAPSVRGAVALRDRLEDNGFETRLKTDQVERLVDLENGLNIIFLLILVMTGIAFAVTAFLLQWLSVVRKSRELALMSSTGLARSELRWFPLLQAFVTAILGLFITLLISFLLSFAVGDIAASYVAVENIAFPPIWHFALGALAVVAIGSLSCLGAIQQIGVLDISKLLRSD